jgi:hypothetical protein
VENDGADDDCPGTEEGWQSVQKGGRPRSEVCEYDPRTENKFHLLEMDDTHAANDDVGEGAGAAGEHGSARGPVRVRRVLRESLLNFRIVYV